MSARMKLIVAAVGMAVALLGLPDRANAADDLLQKIKQRGVMKVCNLAYPPWNVKNPISNEWEGINVDLATEIAKMTEVKIEHVDTDWATILQSVNTGKCDFGISTLWVSAARAQIATFTDSLGEEGFTMFVRADSPDAKAATFADLDKPGKVVVAPSGTSNEKWNKDNFKQATLKSIVGNQMAAALLEVAAGRADIATGGYYGNMTFLQSNPNLKLKALNHIILDPSPLSWPVPAREYFLRDYLNQMLATLERNGTKKKIMEKWTKVAN